MTCLEEARVLADDRVTGVKANYRPAGGVVFQDSPKVESKHCVFRLRTRTQAHARESRDKTKVNQAGTRLPKKTNPF